MESQTEHAMPRVLDTYGLTYAFTALIFVPILFVIDRLAVEYFSSTYLALMAIPFLLGPTMVYVLDSDDGPRTVAIRSAVLAPLVAFTGMTFVFVTMMTALPLLSVFIEPQSFGLLTVLFVVLLPLLASPMLFSLASRVREGLNVVGAAQIVVILAVLGVVAWVVVMTFDDGKTLATFMRRDMVIQFITAFTWYLPALGLASGIWRRTGLV